MREDIVHFEAESNDPLYIQMTGVSYCDGSYRIDRPNAQLYCLEYIIRGKGWVEDGNRRFTARAGDVYLLHQHRDHHYGSDPEDPWEKIWVNFSGVLAEQLVRSYQLEEVSHFPGLNLLPLMEELLKKARTTADRQLLTAENAIMLHRLMQTIYYYRKKQGIHPVHPIAETVMKKLEGPGSFHINLDDIVQEINCSKPYMIRIFKEAYGVTPYDYLCMRRIESAKLLLSDTQMTVGEIAEALGYCDQHYFADYFKQKIGVSPLAYRKNSR